MRSFALVGLAVAVLLPTTVARAAPALHPSQLGGSTHLIVITGLAGDEELRSDFHEWATTLIRTAEENLGVPASNVTYLGEKPELDPATIDDPATRETIEAHLTRIAEQAAAADQIFVVIIGHGSARGDSSRFNLPGPDMTAADFAPLLDRLGARRIAFVNTASSSGDFASVLAAPNRAIVTATRDARQHNQTVFPRFFVEAFASDNADVDKNERVSLLEAYEYARREVRRFYEEQGYMLTETAQLEDNGDGEASHEPDPGTADGALAGTLYLAAPAVAFGNAVDPERLSEDPALRELLEQRQLLEQRIEELKAIKESMDPELYQTELEDLLVQLARTDKAIRDKGGETAP